MGKDTKIDAVPAAGWTPEEQTIADLKATVRAVMDHVIALTTAVQAIAVGGRRPQNVRELDEAVTAARAYRKTL